MCYNYTSTNLIKATAAVLVTPRGHDTRKDEFLMQSDHTPAPYFPENLDDYAPWVAEHGLTAPYGKCQCGCGEDVNMASKSSARFGWRNGCPIRFVFLHQLGQKLREGTDEDAFWGCVRKTELCWEWTRGKHRFGYGWFHNGRKTVTAHRYSYELHFGPIPEGMGVLHRCDNPSCVRPDHLFLGTQADNNADKVRKGRQHRGEGTGGAKLCADDVRQIRELYAAGLTQIKIAESFGICRENVGQIVRRETWKHVGVPSQYPIAGEER